MVHNISSYLLHFHPSTSTASRAGVRDDPANRHNHLHGPMVEGTVDLRIGFDVLGPRHTGCVGGYRSSLGRHKDRKGRKGRHMQGLRIQLDIVSLAAVLLGRGFHTLLTVTTRA